MKTSELTGPALDWAVARCTPRFKILKICPPLQVAHMTVDTSVWLDGVECRFSTSWSQAGPIIEREKICADFLLNGQWLAVSRTTEKQGYGPTPLIAAMRCYVASKLGAEVDIPEELV